MTIKKMVKLLVISVAIISLASCSLWRHKSKKNQPKAEAEAPAYASANENEDTGTEAVTTAYKEGGDLTELAREAATDKCHAAKVEGGVEQHYYFAFDKSNVNPADSTSIKTQANYLHSHPQAKVRIEGNTDDRGSREYNVALAARRANAVIAMLEQEGISKKRIEMVSYGAEKPAATGETEESYRCNRRVDLVFIAG